MMKIECTLSESTDQKSTQESKQELKVKSSSWPRNTVKLIIDDKEIVVDSF